MWCHSGAGCQTAAFDRYRVREKDANVPKKPSLQSGSILQGLRNKVGDQNQDIADWEGANSDLIKRCVCAVGIAGGAIRFGYTRDGSAYSVGIYVGDDRETYYARPYDNIDSLLTQIAEGLEELPRAPKKGD